MAATQTLASTRNKSVRFPVFPDQLGHVQQVGPVGRNLDPDLIQEPVDLLPPALLASLHLALDEVLKEAATARPDLLGTKIEALQELVGNGDHHLGHGMSIYGIASGQNGHGWIVRSPDARVARRMQIFFAASRAEVQIRLDLDLLDLAEGHLQEAGADRVEGLAVAGAEEL